MTHLHEEWLLSKQWIKTAWNDISSEAMVEGFKRDVNRTEDDILCEGTHEEKSFSVISK